MLNVSRECCLFLRRIYGTGFSGVPIHLGIPTGSQVVTAMALYTQIVTGIAMSTQVVTGIALGTQVVTAIALGIQTLIMVRGVNGTNTIVNIRVQY